MESTFIFIFLLSTGIIYAKLIEMMVQANALNGNFVINFGPDCERNILKEETGIAKAVGECMPTNGAAIYGVHNSDFEKQDGNI